MEEQETYVNPNYTPDEPAQPTEAEASETTEEAGAEPAPTEEPAATPEEEKKGVQKRLDEITRKRREAERERDRLAEENARLKAHQAAPPAEGKPVVENFETYEEFVEALTDWKSEQKINQKFSQLSESQRQQEMEKTRATASENFDRKKNEAAVKYADFDEVINNADVVLTNALSDAIIDSEMSGEVMYYLGKNPKEADRLASLPLGALYREMGKIEVKLTTAQTAKPTGAAAPISAVAGKETLHLTNEESMSDDEWLQKERARLKKLGRLY